jgi:hypothetical protein
MQRAIDLELTGARCKSSYFTTVHECANEMAARRFDQMFLPVGVTKRLRNLGKITNRRLLDSVLEMLSYSSRHLTNS